MQTDAKIKESQSILEIGGNVFEIKLQLTNNLLSEQTKQSRTAQPPTPLLNSEQAATYLNINVETLRRLCRRKAITFVQLVPGEYRFNREDLNEFIQSRRNKRKTIK